MCLFVALFHAGGVSLVVLKEGLNHVHMYQHFSITCTVIFNNVISVSN